ncbi:MAG: hypothetical protein ACREWE_11565 [Gammaproteobacteria bacterium]
MPEPFKVAPEYLIALPRPRLDVRNPFILSVQCVDQFRHRGHGIRPSGITQCIDQRPDQQQLEMLVFKTSAGLTEKPVYGYDKIEMYVVILAKLLIDTYLSRAVKNCGNNVESKLINRPRNKRLWPLCSCGLKRIAHSALAIISHVATMSRHSSNRVMLRRSTLSTLTLQALFIVPSKKIP